VALLTFIVALFTFLPAPGAPPAYDALKQKAEASYAEKSFSRAHDLYEQASKLELPPAERRWVEFRLADTAWRVDRDRDLDPKKRDRAREAIERLILDSDETHDLVWAEAHESLGDYYTFHSGYGQNYKLAEEHFNAALDWWAGNSDLPLARARWLDIVWRFSRAYRLPPALFVQALSVAESRPDRDRARLLLAKRLLEEAKPESVERALEHLDILIREGKGEGWDEAVFLYANQISSRGEVVVLDSGESGFRSDYEKALQLYRRLIAETKSDESQYYTAAQRAIDEILSPALDVVVGGNFLPGTEQEVVLSWRNVSSVELTLTPVDLTRDIEPRQSLRGAGIEFLPVEKGRPIRRWTVTTGDRGDHAPGSERVRITPRLEPGAYVIAASGGGRSGRRHLVVTDASILTHAYGSLLQIYVANVMTGEPLPGARVRVLRSAPRTGKVTQFDAETNASGIAEVVVKDNEYAPIFIAAARGTRQAYEITNLYAPEPAQPHAEWRVYAFTDRPAYRPGETVHWKIIARTRSGGGAWSTPSGETLQWTIRGPRSEVAASGTATLNAFGSFWTDLPVTAAMPLGGYYVTFAASGNVGAGTAQLFSIEEYKLPEFRVSVTTPEENGKKKAFRLGETIEATIEATYYSGGPVANATVDVDVQESGYVRAWLPWHQYEWYYDESRYGYWGGGKTTKQTLKSDANGRAVVRIETNRDGGGKRYFITAHVTDASRRQVSGSGSVAAGVQRYSVVGHPEHYLRLPNERTAIDFNAADANDQPVQTTGTIKVVRRVWLPKAETYRDEEVMTTTLSTDAKGNATFTFTPARTGYYMARWTSEDRDAARPLQARDLVKAETAVWVTEHATSELGYHAAGLDLVFDRDTFRVGESAPILIATPASGRWVVLTTTTDRIEKTEVIHLDGTVKLVQIPIGERHAPNFFVTGSSIFDRKLSMDRKRIVVPPAEKFVQVDVAGDREAYEPRQKGTVTVTTRDASGKAIPAEVALSVADDSVAAIRAEIAGDPRPFFYHDLRWPGLGVASSVQSQRYIDLAEEKNEKEKGDEWKLRQDDGGFLSGIVGGVVGGVGAMAPPPAPAPPPPALERITVTAQAPSIEVVVRSDFRTTALWKPDVVTDANGKATIEVVYPEALTTWRATARAVTTDSQFGMASTTSRTTLPLIVRLQAPRFFVAGDRAVVSAVINNNGDAPMRVTPSLEAEGIAIQGRGDAAAVDVPAHGDARVDWEVVAEHPGTATLRVRGRGPARGDGMEKSFPIYEHGIDKLVARSGKLRAPSALVKLELPRERRDTKLTVQIAPSLAVTMLDALPYLIDYPYGCTEQTMSRFLPAAIVARTLAKNGLDANDIEGRIFGGIEGERAGKKDLHELDAMTAASMARLYEFQHGDGGWGWWKEGESDRFMTAYVVWGFAVAKEGELRVNDAAIGRAVDYLDQSLARLHGDWQQEAWILHAVARWRAVARPGGRTPAETSAFDDAWTNRDRLSPYSRALLALAAHDFGDTAHAEVLVRNLEDGVTIDRTPDQSVLLPGRSSTEETIATAHWGADKFWWRWYEGPVETTAFALQAIVAIDPRNALVEPVMNWLVKNRRGARWNNTRDTAIALLALNDYLQQSGELKGDVGFALAVNGHEIVARTIAPSEILSAPSRFAIDPALVHDGVNEIAIRRTTGGDAPLYFAAEARFFSLEEPVTAAGNEIFVRREYFKLVPRPTLLKGVLYDRAPLTDGGAVNSGDRIEVVVTVDAKNDYDYLMFEDLKPAGFEAIALQSGTPLYATTASSNRTAWVYQELRDRKVAMFVDHLPQGRWEIRYNVRAEVPGAFHALPLIGQAMYVPEVRANGEEMRVGVR
jgi:uncharacterized protein YfaS (alpha-2-macroglobulin family)/tetratricopeptide (TPR) repeat protein